MKNWFKTFKTEEFDIIARKCHDETEDMDAIFFLTYDDKEGLEISKMMSFKSEEERNHVFESLTEEAAVRVMEPAVRFVQKFAEP